MENKAKVRITTKPHKEACFWFVSLEIEVTPKEAQFSIITRIVIHLYHKERNNEKLNCFFIVFLCYYIFTLAYILSRGIFCAL